MTEFTRILYGWLAIATPIMIWCVAEIFKGIVRERAGPWQDNKALRLPMAIGTGALAGCFLAAAALSSPSIVRTGASQYYIWIGLTLFAVTEWLIISVSVATRIQLTVALSLLWAVGCMTWQGVFA
jgi:hypothetical protein